MIFKCHCGADIAPGHPSHRGTLINARASLGAALVQMREQLKQLKSKRWAKQFEDQRKRDLALIAALEARIPYDEQRLADMYLADQEYYGHG